MKKIVIFYSFIITTIMALMGFIGAINYQELLSAVLFFPIASYFWFLILPKNNKAIVIPQIKKAISSGVEPLKAEKEEDINVYREINISGKLDKDRRMFIKFIGSAGLSVFFLSIFTKRAQAAFFGSAPGPGTVGIKDSAGSLIDPAKHHPTDGYKISRLDDSSPAYYGFTNKDAGWFIMKEDSSGNYTYAVGSTDFDDSWEDRNLTPIEGGPTFQEYSDAF
jgi:hypothetical protein